MENLRKIKVYIPSNPTNNVGGIEQIFNDLSNYLKQKKIRLNFIFPEKGKNIYLGNYHAFPNLKMGVSKGEDVIVTGHLTVFSIFSLLFLTIKKAKIHYFPFWHDPLLHAKNRPIKKIIMLLFDFFILRFALKGCEKVWYLTSYEKKGLLKLCKTESILSQYSIPLSKSLKNKIEKTKPIQKKYDFLFVGRDAPNKNLNFFIDLASRNLERKFLAISDINKRIYELPENLVVKNNLSLSDFVENLMMSKYLVVPSLYESFSKVSLEALYAGLFVISTNNVKGEEKFINFENYISLNKIEDLYDLSDLPKIKSLDINSLRKNHLFDEDFCFSKITNEFSLKNV